MKGSESDSDTEGSDAEEATFGRRESKQEALFRKRVMREPLQVSDRMAAGECN